jgi:hypothetical protein
VKAPLQRLLDLLDASEGPTAGTSVRLPRNLREAAAVAVELGLAPTTTDLAVKGLRDVLESFAQRLVLEEHYRAHPEARPSLYELGRVAAELDGSPLAQRLDLLRLAADHVAVTRPDATGDDVLLFAEGMDLADPMRRAG